MRFIVHGSSATRLLQIDWDAPVELTAELRAALTGQDVDGMQHGALRKGYQLGATNFPRGTIALRIAEGHEIFLQVPASAERAAVAPAPLRPTTVRTEDDAVFDRFRIVVGDGLDGERVDLIISSAVPELSRAVVQRLIDGGNVTVAGGRVAKSNRRLRRDDVIEVAVARVEGD